MDIKEEALRKADESESETLMSLQQQNMEVILSPGLTISVFIEADAAFSFTVSVCVSL